MATKSVNDVLLFSSFIADKLDDIVARPSGFPINDASDWMLASYWYLNAGLLNSILTLFQANLPGGAFALLRPVVETLIRVHLVLIGDPEVIKRLRSDKFRVNFKREAQKIDNHFNYDGEFKFIVENMVEHLYSFTHLGMEQMRRQFNGLNLEANYPEHEIVSVTGMSTSVKFMVASRLVERFGTEPQQEVVLALLRLFSSHEDSRRGKV